MNYRVTIEPLSDTAKERNPEIQTIYLDSIVLAGQYNPFEVSQGGLDKPADMKPGCKGQINAIMGTDCEEALFQLIRNGLPKQMAAMLALRIIKDRTGEMETKEIASMTIDSSRGGGINGSKI